VAGLVRALASSVAGLPRPASVALEWSVPPDLPGTIVTDPAKVALILRNLLNNALKFTSQGTVAVRIGAAGDALAIEVSDTGIGISPEQLPVIFDMFRQLNSTTTRRSGGVGLGLYIVKRFVERLGGTIDVRSAVGKGSTFRVLLPGYRRDPVEASPAAA
jgi:signal transduction histidine kinase